jgi:hypothetical protein
MLSAASSGILTLVKRPNAREAIMISHGSIFGRLDADAKWSDP